MKVTGWSSSRFVTSSSSLLLILKIVITMIWEKLNDEVPEPSGYMKLLKTMVAEMEDHVLNA